LVDTKPLMTWLDAEIASAPRGNNTIRSNLQSMKDMLLKEVEVNGKPTLVSETDINKLNKVKQIIDAKIKGPETEGIDRYAKSLLVDANTQLRALMDAASPDYGTARSIFARLSPPVERAQKGLVGQIAKKEGDKYVTAARELFDSVSSTPETVLYAKSLIQKANPDAWDLAMRGHMQSVFEAAKEPMAAAGGGWPNGAKLAQAVWGTTKQRDIWKAAMNPAQFQAADDFFALLKKTSALYGAESGTQGFQALDQAMKSSMGSKLVDTVTAPAKTFRETWNRFRVQGKQEDLVAALFAPQAAAELQSIVRMTPGSRAQLAAFTTFLGAVAGVEGPRSITAFIEGNRKPRPEPPAKPKELREANYVNQ
jgi:hypothetical protein